MEDMSRDMAEVKAQVKEIYTALVGDKISRDGGMVRRLDTVEEKVDGIDKRTRRMGTYLKILWTSAGGVAMAIYSLIIKK
jgi:hypothetical protein